MCGRRAGVACDFGDDFCGAGFADRAAAIVDAALRERELAAAGAAFRVEAMQRDGSLFGRQLRHVHAGKRAGAIGMLQENFAGVFKCFDARRNSQMTQRANFIFIEQRIAQAFVFLHDAAFVIKNKRSWKRGDSAVLDANFVRRHSDRIVDAVFRDEFLHFGNVVVIDIEADDLKSVAVFFLKLDQIGNFGPAWPAPGRPEIQKDDFAVRSGKRERLSIEIVQFEIGRLIGIADEADDGAGFRCCRRGLLSDGRRTQCRKTIARKSTTQSAFASPEVFCFV